jgi:hypothetical protein
MRALSIVHESTGKRHVRDFYGTVLGKMCTGTYTQNMYLVSLTVGNMAGKAGISS